MPNYEFGTWETVDTSPKPRVKKEPEVIVREIIKIQSNACMLDRHELCTGISYSANKKGYVRCECECGICQEYVAQMAILEIVERNDAWDSYCANLDYSPMEIEFNSFCAAWAAAKEYYK
jgi:hypothetical protein